MNKELKLIHLYLDVHDWKEFSFLRLHHARKYRYCEACRYLEYNNSEAWTRSIFNDTKMSPRRQINYREVFLEAKKAGIILWPRTTKSA